jgi:caffeoyl-CoA O-methyltransferase
MEFVNEDILAYISGHIPEEPELLRRLDRETHLKVPYPNMLSGHILGRFLAFISKILQPDSILEIGTYTGYSAICLSEGLASGGQLTTIDNNPEVEDIALRYFREAGMEDVIIPRRGDAIEIIPALRGPFDLVFLDADKENYPRYYKLLKKKLHPDGLMMIDNTLWSGKVLEDAHSGDPETRGIQQLNDMISKDPEMEAFLLPLRDGLTIARLKDVV